MIHITDNGGSYSDRQIYFIDSDEEPEVVEGVVSMMSCSNEAQVIATVEPGALLWRAPAAILIKDLFRDQNYLFDDEDDLVEQVRKSPLRYRQRVLEVVQAFYAEEPGLWLGCKPCSELTVNDLWVETEPPVDEWGES